MDAFAAMCEAVARQASRLRKVEILSGYLQSLGDDELSLAVQFLSVGPRPASSPNQTLFPTGEVPKMAVGYSILRDALQCACGWDPATLRTCHAEVGDAGELTALLMRGHSADEPLSLHRAEEIYAELFAARSGARKREILVNAYQTYRPAAVKYFVKVITRGLRMGLLERTVEDAVARAFDVRGTAVRDANNRLGNLARVALAARHGELSAIEAALFHPMDFMLAKPLDRLEDLAEPADWVIEDKYDGIRSQVHFDHGHVQIFSRGMEEVTAAFPEIVEAFRNLSGNGAVDGEILGWREGRALNFNLLQQRLARKSVRASLRAEVPVVFMGYDVLLRDDRLLLESAWEERRSALTAMLGGSSDPLFLSEVLQANTPEDVNQLFAAARERGNEGLLLKRRGSAYEPGRRTGAWLKLKRPYGTLDVVVTAAEQGEGRRAIFLSDYTFAVRTETGFANVGKAYSGLTDAEVKDLTRVLRGITMERFGRAVLVRPEVVLEVAFDGVQKSVRHKSGYALRFPRIVRWRRDKKPEECDDVARVAELYAASLR